MSWLEVAKFRLKSFSHNCVMFSACFVWKSIHSNAETKVDLQQSFFFSRGATLALTRMSFKPLVLLNSFIETFSKTFWCSLSGVNVKCISSSTVLSLKNMGWYVILKKKPTLICCISCTLLFIENFRREQFSCLKGLRFYQLVIVTSFFQLYLQFIILLIKKGVFRKNSVKLQDIAFLQLESWHKLA